MKMCSVCVLPETYPNITFNNEGKCNFCLSHQERKVLGQDALIKRIKKMNIPSCGYDAILGLSGGRDSSFAAYYLVHELKLKILGFTFDNGFMPDTTWNNINKIVNKLGLNHQIISGQRTELAIKHSIKAISHKPSPAMVAFLCSGCYTGLSDSYGQLVEETGCRLVISGSGEPENTFAEYLLSGDGTRRKTSLIMGFLREITNNPHYLDPRVTSSFFQEYIHRFTRRKKKFSSIDLFNYIDWDEDLILRTIKQEFDWQVPEKMSSSWRSDCKVNVIKQYLYKELLGFTKNEELLSQLIRNGSITPLDLC